MDLIQYSSSDSESTEEMEKSDEIRVNIYIKMFFKTPFT